MPWLFRRRWPVLVGCAAVLWVPLLDFVAWRLASGTLNNKHTNIHFFPTDGVQDASHGLSSHALPIWVVDVKGVVYNSMENHPGCKLIVYAARRIAMAMGVPPEHVSLLSQRLTNLLNDYERKKTVAVKLASCNDQPCAALTDWQEYIPDRHSAADGYFQGKLRFLSGHMWPGSRVTFTATNGHVEYTGSARLVGPHGVGVISDIDDTIKVTGVHNTSDVLKNTLLRPFQPVEGMAPLYRRWHKETWGLEDPALVNVSFHYVSGSPWALAKEIRGWMDNDTKPGGSYPEGSFHLKRFRLELLEPWGLDHSIFRLASSNYNMKMAHLRHVLDKHSQRRFVLVGDSSEADPEAYADLARAYPNRVLCIVIRNAPGYHMQPGRRRQAFAGLPDNTIRVVETAEQLQDLSMPSIMALGHCAGNL